MVEKKFQQKAINPNTIAHFKGDYVDDNKKEAKERRHLSLEIESDDLFFLKLTSQREELSQIRIDPVSVKCLNKVSYPVFKRKVRISLTDLKNSNYQYFYICPLHPNGCLDKDLFTKIIQRLKEIWEDELTIDKKVIPVDASKLKPTKEIP